MLICEIFTKVRKKIGGGKAKACFFALPRYLYIIQIINKLISFTTRQRFNIIFQCLFTLKSYIQLMFFLFTMYFHHPAYMESYLPKGI